MAADVRHLDKRVKLVWEFPTIAALAIFWLVASIAYVLFLPENAIFGLSHVFFPIVLLAVVLLIIGLPIHYWTGLVYENFTIELAPQDIIIREGVVTRKTTVIPYSRIQDIRSERTFIERLLGLATLEIETAGSSKVASQTLIPGIANKNELIADIMRLVERARSGDGISAGADGANAQKAASTMETTMLDVLKELKIISSKLDNLGAQNGAQRGRHREKPDVFEPMEHDDDLPELSEGRDRGRSPVEFKKFRKK